MWKEYQEYFRDNPKGFWFKRKLYGWGWTPVKWQGWVVILIYILAMLALGLKLEGGWLGVDIFILPVIFLTSTLIVICYKKGESPRWQWGPPKK